MKGGEVVGVDLEEKLLETARRLARKEGLGDAARFEVGNVYDLGSEDNTFDVAMVQVVLCHLSEPEKALDELIRVTKRGGCVAIFDNATWGGREIMFDPNHEPKLKELMFVLEMAFRRVMGRKKLGQGDFTVGCRVPAWMEARGMKEVDAICNERVYWVAPPYRSSAQKATLRNWKEWNKQFKPGEDFDKDMGDHWDAGGADQTMKRRFRRLIKKRDERARQELADGTVSFAQSPQFWCIWGFKA
jgi:SAM-dependent methyltransferase